MWTSVSIFESGRDFVILLRNFVLFDFLRSYQSVPPNLAAGLDARRESDVMIVSKKEGR